MELNNTIKQKAEQTKHNKIRLIGTENRLMIVRGQGGWGMGAIGEGNQKVQTSRYKTNKS